MGCFLKTILDVLAHIAAPCIKAFREGGEKIRGLEVRATIAEKECQEWKERCLATESRLQAEQEKSARLWAVIVVLFATVFFFVVFPSKTVIVGAVGLSFALGGLLLPEANRVAQYASQGLRLSAALWQSASRQIRPVLGHLVQFAEQIRRSVRDWKWKAVPVSGSLSPTH
jgi:hypothetical protein